MEHKTVSIQVKAGKEEKGNKVQTGQIENTKPGDRFKPKHCMSSVHFLLLHGDHKCSRLKQRSYYLPLQGLRHSLTDGALCSGAHRL